MSRAKEMLLCLSLLVALSTVDAWSTPPKLGPHCDSDGPLSLRPKSYALIRIGMTRGQVERILGSPDYSPTEGQDYFSTGGDCEIAPGRTAPCGFIIEYRSESEDSKDTGRVVQCSWGGIGE